MLPAMRLEAAELRRREEAARAHLSRCRLCARYCETNRSAGEGLCRLDDAAHVAGWGLHFGEEPELTGRGGSGLVLLGGCNLACRGCESASFSLEMEGVRRIGAAELAGIVLELARRGAETVQFVTPTPQLPVIVSALRRAAERGFDRPVVWNCGGYESPEALELLDGVVDVYLPDLKHGTDETGRLTGAQDYATVAMECIAKMHAQAGDPVLSATGVAIRGVMVRHLVLPDDAAASERALRFLAGISQDLYVSLLSQYEPVHRLAGDARLGRRATPDEMTRAAALGRAAGLRRVRVDGREV